MMYENSVLFILSSVLLSCILNADALKCFQCNTYDNPACLDVTAEDVDSPLLKECEQTPGGPAPFCRKNRYSPRQQDFSWRTSRECGFIILKNNKSCYNYDTDFKYERSCICHTDGCNAASMPLQAVFQMALAVGIVLTVQRFCFTYK